MMQTTTWSLEPGFIMLNYIFYYTVIFLVKGLLLDCQASNNNIVLLAARKGYGYTTFQGSIACQASHFPAEPKTLSDIQSIVHYAGSKNLTVKSLGSRQSSSDMICTEGIPITMSKVNHFWYDNVTEVVTVGGGASIYQVAEQLHLLGRALEGLPLYAGISIAGSIATGAHGSSLLHPGSLSDELVGVAVVDGTGNIRNITDPDTLNAFRAHLGLLGIIYEVRLRTVPQFKIHVESELLSDSILENADNLVEEARGHSFVYLWWFPSSKEVIMYKGDRVDTTVAGNCGVNFFPEYSKNVAREFKNFYNQLQDSHHQLGMFYLQSYTLASLIRPVVGRFPYVHEDKSHCSFPAIGYSHKMTTQICKQCVGNQGKDSIDVEESGAVIPVEELDPALKTIKKILANNPTEFPLNGIFMRFLPSSEGLLSSNRGRESVGIEWMMVMRREKFTKAKIGLAQKQAMIQALVTKHQGRTHWGRGGLAYSSPEMIQLQHAEGLPKFVKYMEELDPNGVFLNDFGRRIRFERRKMTLDAKRRKHCALSDHCICSKNLDCGPRGNGNCGTWHGYKVCQERIPSMIEERIKVERNIVKNYLQPMVTSLLRGFPTLGMELFNF